MARRDENGQFQNRQQLLKSEPSGAESLRAVRGLLAH
ncbi:hypothetical protein ACP0HM_20615 [Escherichia coli]